MGLSDDNPSPLKSPRSEKVARPATKVARVRKKVPNREPIRAPTGRRKRGIERVRVENIEYVVTERSGDTSVFMPWRRFTTAQRRFLAELAKTGRVAHSARKARISRLALYQMRVDDEEFAKQWDVAKEMASDVLEDAAFQRAVDGVPDTTGKGVYYSNSILIKLLEAYRPGRYGKRVSHELTGADGGPIKTEGSSLDRAEIAHRIAAIFEAARSRGADLPDPAVPDRGGNGRAPDAPENGASDVVPASGSSE